jgi:uncharacterized membrane protein YkoI
MDDNGKLSKGRMLALVAAGVVAGGVLAGTVGASAVGSSPSPAPGTGTGTGTDRPARPPHPDETPLTGDTADKVKAAVLAKYPGATVMRLETDSDGVYEAHIRTQDGKPLVVEVGKDFTVTGEEKPPPPGPGGPGMPGMPGMPGGRHGGPHGTPLTGDTLAKVKAAVEAKYPGATVMDAETGDDGAAYEAHIVKADGTHAAVELDKSFAVTGEEHHGPR